MPNWVASNLIISGKNSDKVMKSLISKDSDGNERFDFNKIVPMPDSLKIVSGGLTMDTVSYYLSTLSVEEYKKLFEKFKKKDKVDYFKSQKIIYAKNTLRETRDKIISRYSENSKCRMDDDPILATEEDIKKYGKQAIDNVLKYGFQDWYYWSIANWGTKWNACNTIYYKDTPNEIYFETAWSDVRKLLLELSLQFPENTFYYEYAEEQTGYYCGFAKFQNGEVLENVELPEYSKEAYEMSFNIWGDGIKDYYKFNEEKNTYEYIEDEESEDDGDAEM